MDYLKVYISLLEKVKKKIEFIVQEYIMNDIILFQDV